MKRHLIGIGGVGMSALATALVRLGDEVTGADRTLGTPNVRFLEALGVKVFPDDGSGVDRTTDEVIVSTAIEETNAGLAKAKELGIPVTHRAKALSRTLKGYKLVAVVGTCGKSTVTAMLGHVLAECGLDPMCVNGANVPGWEGAVRFGKGAYAVAEVDESDKSLVAFKPYAAIVTNASADHYSKEEMDEVFDAFIRDCEGPVVDGRKENCSIVRLGDYSIERLRAVLPIPGKHNLKNAEHAVRMAVALGVPLDRAIAAMKSFRGVERRLQLITPPIPQSPNPPIPQSSNPPITQSSNHPITQSSNHPITQSPVVYDDYAHNPEKLRAMWTTLAEKHPEGICVVWRPHGYAPLRKMMDALAAMFVETIRPCDKLLLLPVYDAGGTTDRSVNSDALVARIESLVSLESTGPIGSLESGESLGSRGSLGSIESLGALESGESLGPTPSPLDLTTKDSCVVTSVANATLKDSKVTLISDLEAAYRWCAAHKSDYAAFVTCGARDPGLPVLAKRLSEM